MTHVIFHIDVNSAFLSWTAVEQLKNGEKQDLRKIPSIIGGDQKSRHGVVLAKSILAKKYGIRTGEPVANAFRKCPNLVTAAPDYQMYRDKSRQLMEYLGTFTDKIEQFSIDECYIDMTEVLKGYSSLMDLALEIKNTVKSRFGFTVNIGISTNKLLAKMASDFEKPDKIHTLFPHEISEKMWPLPISELYMAGHSSVEALKKLEIQTIGDLAKADIDLVMLHLKNHGKVLWEYANGIDRSHIQAEQVDAKGVGKSITLSSAAETLEEIYPILDVLSKGVASRMEKLEKKASMVSVEIKYHDFRKFSHQKQLQKATNDQRILYQEACRLFEEIWTGEPIRLVGVRTAKLCHISTPEQISLFDVGVINTRNEKEQKK